MISDGSKVGGLGLEVGIGVIVGFGGAVVTVGFGVGGIGVGAGKESLFVGFILKSTLPSPSLSIDNSVSGFPGSIMAVIISPP